jgi:molecular chaperone DnaK (HSP70)
VVYDLEEAETQLTLENLDYGVFENLGTVTAKDFGGDDIEDAVFNHAVSEFREKHNIKIPKNSQGGKRLKLEVERAQTKLQNESSADVEFLPGESFIPVSITITTAQIQDLNTKLSDRVLTMLEQLLESHKIGKNEIDGVVFAGNPKHVAKIQPIVEVYFDGMKGIAYDDRIAPDIAATKGAASQAAYIHYEEYDFCTLGAYDILTDLSLGVETSGGVFTTVVPRDVLVPKRMSGVFSTATDNQDRVTIKVLEGERKKASENRVLGTLELTDLPKKPRNELEVEIEFELDANNVLKVEARVQEVGKKVTQIFRERASLRYTQQQFDEIVENGRENYRDDVLLLGERPLYNPDEIHGLWVPDS